MQSIRSEFRFCATTRIVAQRAGARCVIRQEVSTHESRIDEYAAEQGEESQDERSREVLAMTLNGARAWRPRRAAAAPIMPLI